MKILVILAVLTVVAQAGDPWPSRLPEKLTLCYSKPELSNRFRRLPQSLDNLLAIIRKIEAHPHTALWPMGKMAVTLLKRFRYDGVIDTPESAPGIVPIEIEGVESGKYRLQWRLTPGVASDFPEAALTLEEECSLHWMLSYSVNHTMRTEERLPGTRSFWSSVSSEAAASAEDKHDHDAHGADQEEHSEHEDHDKQEDDEPAPEEAQGEEDHAGHDEHEGPKENSEENKETETDVVEENGGDENEEEEADQQGENQDFQPDEGSDGDGGQADDEGMNFWGRRRRRRQAALPVSPRPLELGIVNTKGGPVAMGSVLAGIAAGAEPQSAQLKDIIKDPTLELSSSAMERTIESVWAATLAADIGQSALIRGSHSKPSFGPRGQWNNTFCPREYSLSLPEHSLLTSAEFYGGLDGLLIGKRMANWDTNSYMKLSTILEMYYSESGIRGDGSYRACNRLNHYKEALDKNMLKEQALSAALVMYSRGISGAPTIPAGVRPIDRIGQYVNATMAEIERFINNNANVEADYQQCLGLATEPTTPAPATHSDVTFVLDQFDPSNIPNQKELIATLALAMDIRAGASRLEVVSSKDGSPLILLNATTNKAELACQISNLNPGQSERRIATVLENLRKRISDERKIELAAKTGGGNKRSVIFFVTNYMSASGEKAKIKEVEEAMIKEMPDVHIMFVTLASPEEFRPFVKNFERDIVRMANFPKYSDAGAEVANRLATISARLSYPECKDLRSSSNATEAKYLYSQFVSGNTVQYYRVGAEHFHSSVNLVLRFRTSYGVARYCISRSKENPGTGDDCKSATKADETVEFVMLSPCSRMLPETCSPIWVSVTPVGIDDNVPCSEKSCLAPDQIKFTFSHTNMRCSGHAIVSMSSLVLSLVALLTWLLNRH